MRLERPVLMGALFYFFVSFSKAKRLTYFCVFRRLPEERIFYEAVHDPMIRTFTTWQPRLSLGLS